MTTEDSSERGNVVDSSERGNVAGSEDGKSGQEPRNGHRLWKLEKAKKWVLS